MQEEEYTGSIWKPYSHIILNMCSTHQCYGLNIDLKLCNAYLRKLSTQFSISNSTLTQLLCRSAGAGSTTADILHWGTHVVPKCYCRMGWRCRWGLRPASRRWPFFSLAASCGVNHKFQEAAPHLEQAQPQLRGSTHAVLCRPGPRHRLMTG